MAPENVNVITNINAIKSYHELDEVLLVLTKNVVYCSNGGIKYKLDQRFVAHFIFNRKKILCIHVEALDSDVQLLSKMLIHF